MAWKRRDHRRASPALMRICNWFVLPEVLHLKGILHQVLVEGINVQAVKAPLAATDQVILTRDKSLPVKAAVAVGLQKWHFHSTFNNRPLRWYHTNIKIKVMTTTHRGLVTRDNLASTVDRDQIWEVEPIDQNLRAVAMIRRSRWGRIRHGRARAIPLPLPTIVQHLLDFCSATPAATTSRER
eukprot:CAMPEP_0172302688 /NCGR_PEP_ID=MMETSP1058-20130122/4359_1 /TAXON_ID=83371 /ORGANISM="Detonula confervacea, Strain CCMP 353" /LENGTH=182 /DNA_ID=CAMNT_0013013259 /DNA_START=26 /DNA_END=574 /DNA_ORIENTATION=-